MEHANEASLLGEYVPLLGFALVFVLVFRRFGLGATLGYLVAGAIVGPQVLGLVGDAESKMGIAELGIALLLFLVGLELSPARLWRMRRDIFGLGLLQVTICGLVIAGMVWLATGSSIGAALALGLPLALSSTAQVLPMLQSAGRLRTPLGEREMFIFAGLFTVIAAAAIMEALGLSAALGAFIAGVMLADSPYRHELEADVEPFRSILLGLFFLAVGMTLNLHAIAERPFFVVGMALALIAAKAALIMGLGLLFGVPRRQAFALGVLLSQGGEFGFVLFAQAQSAMLIEGEAASIFGAIVTLSMATTPFLMMATRKLRTEPAPSAQGVDTPQHEGANAVVVGYGRFGQTVAQMLLAQDIPVTLIDTDVEMIQTASDFGMKVYYGDGLRIDLLRQAGAAEAELVLFCNDGDRIDTEFLEAVHHAFPKATIFVRAYDRRSVIKMKGAPVGGVVREVLESAVMMARQAMQAVGVDQMEIDKTEAEYRRRDSARLDVQRETGDLRAGIDGMITHASRAAAIEIDLESSG